MTYIYAKPPRQTGTDYPDYPTPPEPTTMTDEVIDLQNTIIRLTRELGSARDDCAGGRENDVKLWKISWPDYDKPYWYDRYDSAVVTAETEAEAQAVHPGGYPDWGSSTSTWAASPNLVVAEEIGTTGLPAGKVVCASFNAA